MKKDLIKLDFRYATYDLVCVWRRDDFQQATCCEECPYQISSKTKVEIANKPEVRLCKMDEKTVS